MTQRLCACLLMVMHCVSEGSWIAAEVKCLDAHLLTPLSRSCSIPAGGVGVAVGECEREPAEWQGHQADKEAEPGAI